MKVIIRNKSSYTNTKYAKLEAEVILLFCSNLLIVKIISKSIKTFAKQFLIFKRR